MLPHNIEIVLLSQTFGRYFDNTYLAKAQQLLRWTTIWPQQTWAENWRAAVSLSMGGAGSPSNTTSPGLRPTSVPSGIFIHPAVWPQQTWAGNLGKAVSILWGGKLSPQLTQRGLGRGLPPYQVSS